MVRVDYVRKILHYSHVSFFFVNVTFLLVKSQLRDLCFCYHNTINVVFWYVQVTHKSYIVFTFFLGFSLWHTLHYVTTTFFQAPKTYIFNNIRNALFTNYVRKYDTIILRTGSSFLDYFFVVRLYKYWNNVTAMVSFCVSLWHFITTQLRYLFAQRSTFWWRQNYVELSKLLERVTCVWKLRYKWSVFSWSLSFWFVCIKYGNNVKITLHICSSKWRILENVIITLLLALRQ